MNTRHTPKRSAITDNRFQKMLTIIMMGLTLSCLSGRTAHAGDCDQLDQNEQWTTTFSRLNTAFRQEDWSEALRLSKTLEGICEHSPILNYTIANIHKRRGDNEKYIFYLQKSTQNTERFSVDKDLLDQIWSDKYIATHPEADPDRIKAQSESLADAQRELSVLKRNSSNIPLMQEQIESAHRSERAMLWTSVSVAAAGLVMTTTGAILLANNNNLVENSNTNKQVHISANYAVSWCLLGVGIATTLLGTASSAYFGYKYRKNQANTDSLSFSITPAYSSLTLSF